MSDYPTESPNDDLRGRLGVAAMDVYAAEDDRRRAREAEIAKRMDRVRIDSPPDEFWVDVVVGKHIKTLRFSRSLYLREPVFTDREIQRSEDELKALASREIAEALSKSAEIFAGIPRGPDPGLPYGWVRNHFNCPEHVS